MNKKYLYMYKEYINMEYNQNFLNELSKLIINVIDEKGESIIYKKLEIKLEISKYSSSHSPSPVLIIDGKSKYYRNSNIKIKYKCICGVENEILWKRFLTKTTLKCQHCRETEEKRKWHSEVLKMKHKKVEYVSKRKDKKRQYDFHLESDEFKEEYFSKNLTLDEFEKVKKYIYSIKNIVVKNTNYELLPYENGINHKKYRQMVLIDGVKYPFKDIVLQCPLCGRTFSISRMIKERVINNNFDCKNCYLNNKTFALKKINNDLQYQGKQELKFINECVNRQIEIVNGKEIEYVYKNKKHVYKIDFYLPLYKYQIEIKDNHIWHRKQVENGKWEAKEKSAIAFCEKNNMKYFLLFPQDLDDFFKNLERDSLNFNES